MEWVETTAKTLDEAKEAALDRLGIGPDDAEFEVLEEPRTGLFGLRRGTARIRARVRPAVVRPKQDRRQRRREGGRRERDDRGGRDAGKKAATAGAGDAEAAAGGSAPTPQGPSDGSGERPTGDGETAARSRNRRRGGRGRGGAGGGATARTGEAATSDTVADPPPRPANYGAGKRGADVNDENNTDTDGGDSSEHAVSTVAVADVQAAAENFGRGLLDAFGIAGAVETTVEGTDIELRLEPADGATDGVGLLIGPGGRTLLAVQELARVAAQRRLGDHETRLRVDVAGYRERRRSALDKFAHHVADLVKESGIARSLDPMPSPDRKVIHDVLAGIEGVSSRSEGEDPNRRIVVSPAVAAD